MEKIRINHRTGPVTYTLYEKEEADRDGVVYKENWRDGQEGDYVLTDDGIVAKVIVRREYPGNRSTREPNVYMQFAFGYIFMQPSSGGGGVKLRARGRKSRYTLTGKKALEVKTSSNKYRNLAMAYAQTFNPDLAIEMVYGPLPPNRMNEHRRRMRTEEFKKVVREEIGKLLSDSGFTEHQVIEELKKAMEMAKNKNDVSNLMRAVELLVDMHGMNQKKAKTVTREIETSRTRRLIDRVGTEEERLKLKEKREVDDDEQVPQEAETYAREESEEYGEAETGAETQEV